MRATGAAYLRFGDGDFRLSELEIGSSSIAGSPASITLMAPSATHRTSQRLGIDQLMSARNLTLVRISQYIRLRDRTVIEAMASGIPRVRTALDEAGLREPEFQDQGIRCTAIVHRRPPQSGSRGATSIAGTPAQARVLALLDSGQRTSADLAAALGISPQAVRRMLAALASAQLVDRQGLIYLRR